MENNIFKDTSQHERRNRVILSPKNSDCELINQEVLNRLPGDSRIYYSMDTIQTDDPVEAMRYQPEFLNSLTPSGMPPHKLILKPGCIVMLLRNISVQNGLCNGTRLEMIKMHQHSIEASLMNGALVGKYVLIPRIKLAPSDPKLAFILFILKPFLVRLLSDHPCIRQVLHLLIAHIVLIFPAYRFQLLRMLLIRPLNP